MGYVEQDQAPRGVSTHCPSLQDPLRSHIRSIPREDNVLKSTQEGLPPLLCVLAHFSKSFYAEEAQISTVDGKAGFTYTLMRQLYEYL